MLESTLDITSIRQELPSVTSHIYMNAASFGPLLRCVPQAMNTWLQKECCEGRPGMATFETIGVLYAEARNYLARLLNAETDEIALTGNTGEGMNIVCQGLKWLPGDEVIITDHEHVSVIILLHYLRDRYGITIRVAELGPGATVPAEEAIASLITPRTRLIVLSHVSFMTGVVLDVRAVAELAHRSDIPVLVDGAQSAGVIPIDVKELDIDFYALPMQKWLCGPDGTGALYVRRKFLEHLQLSYVGGWFSLLRKESGGWGFQNAARRFELGGRHTAAVAGQIASLRWLEETATYRWVFERISYLNNYAYEAIKNVAGVSVLTPHPGASGLLTFTLDASDVGFIEAWLQHNHNIYVRAIFEHNALRISTGFYNTEEEIDCLAQALCEWKNA
ncbi:cysteine lyase [Reticulibacter mediterranei]|uniref:Cysteine lyase n=1 Tax=Reticulibacter mediterranei TaxID=2778369 RepID=A0A8J3IHY9_9CHLR|nr:aminotransferase class V-fold PLP-dependent enzyme [Reticulibacter mediterranei]GHO91095.1 cysteine lyase [Reticulibacter mediterranei]